MSDDPTRYRGIVKWFAKNKGYGFIAYQDGEHEVFVHYSAILRTGQRYLEKGDPVEFSIEETGQGTRAVRVLPL